MEWGTFGIVHIISLIIGILLNLIVYFIASKLKGIGKTIFLLPFSLLGICAIIYNLVMWNSPFEYLPLELCSLNAIILPIVLLTKNKTLGNCLVLWSLGALMALVMNQGASNFLLNESPFYFYYLPHVFEFGLPIILAKLNYFELKFRYIISTLLITIGLYTAVHFINIAVNNYCEANNITDYTGKIIQVNYMYSLVPANPALEFFYKYIPYSYWYMYAILPIIVVYLAIVNGINALIVKYRKPTVRYI